MIYISINNFIKHLYSICDPQDKYIYICIDGCTSINKLNE
jgi:5'-3' exonuclease